MDETSIEVEFGGEHRLFWLPMPRIIEIERICGDRSIVEIYEGLTAGIGLERETAVPRFMGTGSARIRDIFEVIRCAAIGGGMNPNDASQLVRDYVDGRPLSETAPVAWAILHAAIMGVRLGSKKKEAGESPDLTEKVT